MPLIIYLGIVFCSFTSKLRFVAGIVIACAYRSSYAGLYDCSHRITSISLFRRCLNLHIVIAGVQGNRFCFFSSLFPRFSRGASRCLAGVHAMFTGNSRLHYRSQRLTLFIKYFSLPATTQSSKIPVVKTSLAKTLPVKMPCVGGSL